MSVYGGLLGGGIPFLSPPSVGATLKLRTQRVYPKTGTVALEYDVESLRSP